MGTAGDLLVLVERELIINQMGNGLCYKIFAINAHIHLSEQSPERNTKLLSNSESTPTLEHIFEISNIPPLEFKARDEPEDIPQINEFANLQSKVYFCIHMAYFKINLGVKKN